MKRWLCCVAMLCCLLGVAATAHAAPSAEWIWSTAERKAGQAVCLRTQFAVGKPVRRAELVAAIEHCDAVVYLNGKPLAQQAPYGQVLKIDVATLLRSGSNGLGVCCRSATGPAAVAMRLEVTFDDGTTQAIVTGDDWQVVEIDPQSLARWPDEKGAAWKKVTNLGAIEAYRWGWETDTIAINPADDYTQWMRASGAGVGTDPKTFQIPHGFKVELLRSAAKDEDSWVCLARDPAGRWIIGMEKRGLLRLTLPAAGGETKVERINDTLQECRGLVFADGALYAMANNDRALYRLRDADGNGSFEQIDKLWEFAGDVGHGRNQLTLGPDGQVWGIFGDSVFEPERASKLPPPLAQPTTAEKERSGFVARFGKDAATMEVVVRGLRNPYGLAFNRHGDLFTYDADAEYDMGSPWYRPTRVNHLLPGGDYGWRRVTQQWPPYFPDRADTPQPTLDIGKGSPTAVEFGSGTMFPPRYRDALYVLDWAYGRILAVHLTPRGSSYFAAAETFLRGQPLNVTDIEFGVDGAMYFVTGGRGTQSALYRVTYDGPAETPGSENRQQAASDQYAEQARTVRRRLEALAATEKAPDVADVWPQLGSDDPWIRHAARVALEKIPAEKWAARATSEGDLDTRLATAIALARRQQPVPDVAERWAEANERQKLEILYLVERAQTAGTLPNDAYAKWQARYPDPHSSVNLALCRLLALHPDDEFVGKTMALLAQATGQAEKMHYLFALRHAKNGWTEALRASYFQQLKEMDEYVGGEGLPGFRKLIRQEALAALPDNERQKYEKLLTAKTAVWQVELPPARSKVVRKWTADELVAAWDKANKPGDLRRGKEIFAAARCIACHRCGGAGGVSGPELASVSRRYAPRDLITAMLEPSRAIDEKYADDVFELTSGRVVTGRVMPGDYRAPELAVVPNLLEPEKTVTFAKTQIAARRQSSVSAMPNGLLDCFTEEEVANLLAYLLAGGESAVQAAAK